MKIIKINSQSRNDFWADYQCEHCEHISYDVYGYDDANFHVNVIPTFLCSKCNKDRSGKSDDENSR